MMQAASTRSSRVLKLAVCLALAPACLCAGAITAAQAIPTVTVHGKAVPIPGFPGTGNFYGKGAAVQAVVSISGHEYANAPAPLIGVQVFLPAGVKLHPQGFPTCSAQAVLEEKEPTKCPKNSKAGSGSAYGVVSFGTERVPETVELSAYYAPGGGFYFLVLGHTPASIEVSAMAKLLQPNGGGGFGPEYSGEVPLVATVPGAPYASTERISLTMGSAYRKHGKPVYYGTVPLHCPTGGFRVKGVFTFAENGNPATPESVTVPFRAPCPTH